MQLWSAFLLGVLGSLHCALMCGPLVLAMHMKSPQLSRHLASRLIYQSGRIGAYGIIGLIFGSLGHLLAVAGFQNGLSLGAGIVILASLWLPAKWSLTSASAAPVVRLKKAFGHLLQRPATGRWFLLGILNGLLPCGLVYVAAMGAVATGNVVQGLEYMTVFGLGTAPMMLGLGVAGHKLSWILRSGGRLIPLTVALVGVLLILRGLALGIPFISPAGPCHIM